MWLCNCTAPLVDCFVVLLLRYSAAPPVCDCMALRLCGFPASRLPGFPASRLRGLAASRIRNYVKYCQFLTRRRYLACRQCFGNMVSDFDISMLIMYLIYYFKLLHTVCRTVCRTVCSTSWKISFNILFLNVIRRISSMSIGFSISTLQLGSTLALCSL